MLLERLILKTDKYGLSWHDCEIIADASVLHDIGKIEIDSKILNKPGRLTPKEREEVKKHAVMICTPKVRHFWRCIFLWRGKGKSKKDIVQNSN